MEFFETKAGTIEMDILAYVVASKRYHKATPGELFYRREYKVHHQVGAAKKSFVCPTTFGKKCPICEYRDELAADYKANEKLIQALKPQTKDLYYIDSDGKGEKFRILDISHHNFTKKLAEEIREGNEDWVGFADLERGYTLKVRFVEENFAGKKYLQATRIDFSQRKDYPESVLEKLPDMDELLVEVEYSVLNKIFLELDDDEPVQTERNARGRDSQETAPEPITDSRRGHEATDAPPITESRRGREVPEMPAERGRRGRVAEEEVPPPTEEPVSTRRRQSTDSAPNPCPSGFEFGIDTEKYDVCQTCPSGAWEACLDRRDELASAAKIGGRRR
jgi:hypothetical protein